MDGGLDYYEDDIIADLKLGINGYYSLVYVRVEDNVIKYLRRLNWKDVGELLTFLRNIHNDGYLYDDAYATYSKRSKHDGKHIRESYQLPDRNLYIWTKKELDLE